MANKAREKYLDDAGDVTVEGQVCLGRQVELAGRVMLREGAWIGDRARIGVPVRGLKIARRYPAAGVAAAATEIGRYAFIGAGAMVQPGVRIANGAAVAPNSDVVGDIPSFAVVRGQPARVIGRIEDFWTGKLDAAVLGPDWRRRPMAERR